MLSSIAVPVNGFSLNLPKPNFIVFKSSRVLYGAFSLSRLFKPPSYSRIRIRCSQKENVGNDDSTKPRDNEDEKPSVDEILKKESAKVSEKKVPFIVKLGMGLGLAMIITVICVTLKGSSVSPFEEVKSVAKVSSSSEGFTFNAFGNRFMIPANAPGWVYFWLLMAAGCGLFISEEALNIWVGITLAQMLTLDGTWQSFAESFSRNAPYIVSTVSWVYWGVCLSDMIPFYLGKLFRQSGASDDVCSKLGIGKEKAMSITQAIQKYGNLSGFVERFSLGMRNPTAFFAGALGISPECFFAGVCCGGLITLPLQMSSPSSHDSNNELCHEEVQGEEDEVQVQTSVGKKRTETERSSSDLPPKQRQKLAQSSHFVPKEDDTERSRTRNHIERCKIMFKANQEESDEQEVSTSDSSGNHLTFDQDLFRKSVNEMIVLNGLPFAFTESEGFMRFCNNLLPGYEEVPTRTVTKDIVAMFLKEKDSLKKLFSDDKMRVSLTTDIWVAPTTSCSYLVVTAFWIDANWELQKRIISFKPVTDREGSTIARHLIECVDEWGIEKVFTVTVDNSEGNDTALTLFKDAMRLKGVNALVKDGEFLRMRCCGHIVNLIVKDCMECASDSIAAVRNAVKYVQSSFTRLKSFQMRVETGKVSKGGLSLDSVTRWDSTYLMLNAALRLRVAFDKMLDEDKLYGEYFLELEKETGKKRVGPPISATWDEVERLVLFLSIFFDCTMRLSGSKSAASSNGYTEIANIGRNLISLSNNVDEEVKKQATSMRDKFENYWDGLININPLVIVASVFDPRKKMLFASLCFDKLHGKDSLECNHLTSSIRSVMRQLYEEYIIMLNKESQSDDAATQSDHGDSKESRDVMYDLYEEYINKMRKEQAGKELDDYLIDKVEPRGSVSDVLSWWKHHSDRYPILSELARDVLAIQMSSFAPESAFCTSGRILDPYTSSLTPFITEALICTQQWLRTSVHFEAQFASFAQMIEELDFHQSLDSRKQPESGEV